MRVEQKMKGRKVNDVLNRLHLAMPTKRDNKDRPPCIPAGIAKKRQPNAMEVDQVKSKRTLERELEIELADDYILDLQSEF